VDAKKDIVIKEKEFFVAVTLGQLESANIDYPLCVAKITASDWKKV
jgi:hypothetical protein